MNEIKQKMSNPGSRTRAGVLQVRQIHSSVHKDRPCQPCILCKQGNQSKYFYPKQWKDATLLESLRQSEPLLNILPDSCICRLCRDDLSKLGNEGHTPRWRRINTKCNTDKRVCYVPDCCNPSIKVIRLASKGTINELFQIPSENQHHTLACDENPGYPLYQEHCRVLYRHLNSAHFNKQSKTCKKLMSFLTKTRKCPEPAIVQTFLAENTEFTEEIKSDDRVCYACYKSHLVIIKHVQNSSHSTDQTTRAD